VELGVVFPQDEIGTDPDGIAAWARAVEDGGLGYVDVFDHVLGADRSSRPGWSGTYDHRHAFHEPMVLYGFLAAHTARVGLATGVLVLPQRQPVLVAKQAAEVDLLSRGRLRLGVGIGWNAVEYHGLGQGFADRAARYEEQIGLLRRLWTEPVVTHEGRFHAVDRAGLAPLPAQRPIPLWLGGGTAPAVLDRVGRLADGWVVHDPDPGAGLARALDVVAETARRHGRDPAGLGVQGRIDVHGPLDADRLRRGLDAWRAVGATHVSVHGAGQPDHLGFVDAVAAIATEVTA
jgi:probable F420-dependent oxidoreductase